MLQTVRLILLFSTIAAVCCFIFKYKNIKLQYLFFIFCLELLIYEVIMFFTAQMGVKNHIIANINNLVYFSLATLVLFKIWETLKGKTKGLAVLKVVVPVLILMGWFLENFIINDIFYYNSLLSTICSLMLVGISIYLINVMLFLKTNSIFKDSEGLLLIGMVIRSFSGGLILLFMNYRMQYNQDFYINILVLVNIAYIISNIFFIFSIICLPKKRKYTWPF